MSYAGARALVTGGAGFMGFNLVRALRAADARVSVLSRSWPPSPEVIDSSMSGVTYIKGDTRDAVVIDEAVRQADVIFHLAAKSGSVVSNASPLDDVDVNIRGTLILLDSCRRLNPHVKVVFPSSRLVYSTAARLPVDESAATRPLSIYGIHKLAVEHYLLLYQHLYGLRPAILRVTNPYGPFQRPEQKRYGIVNWLIHEALHDRTLSVYGEGAQLRDYIHVDDAVAAMMAAGLAPEADGKIFNVGSGHGISFVGMAELIIKVAGRGRVTHVEWPPEAALVETGDFVADISLIGSELGWKPTIPLESGIRDVIACYAKLDLDLA
jgi:UDP-glucose 4-epimerase